MPALTAIAQEYTMSGLDGDAEGGYYIRGMLYLNGASSSYALRTNGLTTNQKGAYTNKDTGPATNAQVSSLQFTGADALTNIVSLSQAEYDAIGSKSSTTLYVKESSPTPSTGWVAK